MGTFNCADKKISDPPAEYAAANGQAEADGKGKGKAAAHDSGKGKIGGLASAAPPRCHTLSVIPLGLDPPPLLLLPTTHCSEFQSLNTMYRINTILLVTPCPRFCCWIQSSQASLKVPNEKLQLPAHALANHSAEHRIRQISGHVSESKLSDTDVCTF